MRAGPTMRETCRRFVAGWLVAVCLISDGGASAAVTVPALPAGEAATQTSPSSEAGGVGLDRVYRDALPSVLLVETESWSGIGFLADSSGLIVTAPTAARPARFLAVTVAPGKKVAARPMKGPLSAPGMIQVNPEAVAGLRPLSIAGPEEKANPPAEGDGLVAILLSPEGGFTRETGTITKVGGWYLSADMPVPPGPGSCAACPSCGPGRVRCGTGLVLDSRGRVLGLDLFTEMKRRPRTRIQRIRNSGKLLAAALAEAAMTPPPAPALLPVAPSTPYPREALDRLAAARSDPGQYQTRAGPFLVEFLTPPLARAGGKPTGDGEEAGGEGACSQPKGDLNRWRPGFSDESPVVTVRVIPEIRRRAGTYVGVTLFWILSPVIYVAMVLGGGPVSGPPHVSSRFDPSIREIELLRGDTKVEPFHPGRVCGAQPLLNIDLCPPEGQQREKRRVKGCYLAYTYPAEVFAPGEPMELRILREEEEGGSGPESIALDEALIQRIWSDFQPYRETTGVK